MKKGVTLVELLVAILIGSGILLATMQAFSFIENTRKETLDNAQINYALQNIRDYIIQEEIISINKEKPEIKFNTKTHTLVDVNDDVLYDDLPFDTLDFKFNNFGAFIQCTIEYSTEEMGTKISNLKFIVTEGHLEEQE